MKNKNFSDYVVALTVLICSAVLFIALASAIRGGALTPKGEIVRARFPDITGINIGSHVKYAGAPAGTVTSIRILSTEEREESGNPNNAIEVDLSFNGGIPPLKKDSVATISSDTLLSDKFIAVSPGTPDAPRLAEGEPLQGIAPVTFDELTRLLGNFLVKLDALTGGMDGLGSGVKNLIPEFGALLSDTRAAIVDARKTLNDANELIAQARKTLDGADHLVADANGLVSDARQPLLDTLRKLEQTAGQLDTLSKKATNLIDTTRPDITSALDDLRVASVNLKIAATHARILADVLVHRPNALIFGGRPRNIPTAEQILQSNQPVGINQ